MGTMDDDSSFVSNTVALCQGFETKTLFLPPTKQQEVFDFLVSRYTEEHSWSPPHPKEHPEWQKVISNKGILPELSFALLANGQVVGATTAGITGEVSYEMKKVKIGIVGATGAVGTTLLELFLTHQDAVELICYASARSAGKPLICKDKTFELQVFDVEAATQCDVIFLCVSGDFSLQYGRQLAQHSYVIDNSSAFRYEADVPLIVPPVNAHSFTGQKLIANPNCSSAIALVVLAPLHRAYGIEHLTISTYQAASGAGKPAMEELLARTQAFTDYDPSFSSDYFFHDLAYNVVPQVDKFQDNLYTKEEMKMVWEIQKVLEEPTLPIDATAVRVPAFRSHAESVGIKFTKPVARLEDVRSLFDSNSDVDVKDDIDHSIYPMPVSSTYKHAVEVGRIRFSQIYGHHGINLFISGDQLLRGAALNAYEIYHLIDCQSL